jgi:NAD(P)H-dependent FMN reductase
MISGSQRTGSFNTKLLNATAKLLQDKMEITIPSPPLLDLPMFNQDTEKPTPESVKNLKKMVI